MEGGKEQNFWPGFVDALSNVVLVMIFVVVVFVVTLFYYSQKLAQMKVSKIVAQSQSQTVQGSERQKSAQVETPEANDTKASQTSTPENNKAQEIEQLKREVAVLKAKLAAPPLQSDNGSLRSTAAPSSPNAIQVKTDPNQDKVAPGVQVQADPKALTLNFDADSTQLSADGTKALERGLADWVRMAKAKQGKIVVTGVISSAGYSDGRRKAYYRTVAVRNYLLDQGVDKERVVSRVATGENDAQNASSVVVQYLAGAK